MEISMTELVDIILTVADRVKVNGNGHSNGNGHAATMPTALVAPQVHDKRVVDDGVRKIIKTAIQDAKQDFQERRREEAKEELNTILVPFSTTPLKESARKVWERNREEQKAEALEQAPTQI